MGKLLVVIGVIVAGIGLLMIAGVPFGRLPGDVVYRRGNATFYFPVVSSIVISLLLTLFFTMFRR